MKNILIVTALSGLLLSSCRTSQMVSYTDDVYANPKEEKNLARLAAEEKAKKEALERQQKEELAAYDAAQKAKDEANPYYKDPAYNSADDYYDYEYASRINRFYNPIGVGYYDSYYTNLYFYNQNPRCWGTSIYNNWGMPSNTFYNYSWGISTGWGYASNSWSNGWNSCYNNPYYGYNYYDPWGYCDPWYGGGYGYNNYWNGYNNGYWNGYNAGFYNGYWGNQRWTYYNSFDVNSGYGRAEYGPRGTNGGGNNYRRTTAGMEIPEEGTGRREYVQSVVNQQNTTPRFTQNNRRVIRESGSPNYTERNGTQPSVNNGNSSPGDNSGSQGTGRRRIVENGNEGWNSNPSNNTNNSNSQTPTRRRVFEDKGNSTHQNDNSNNNSQRGGWNSGNSGGGDNRGNSGGSSGSSPRNSGTGGGDGGGRRR